MELAQLATQHPGNVISLTFSSEWFSATCFCLFWLLYIHLAQAGGSLIIQILCSAQKSPWKAAGKNGKRERSSNNGELHIFSENWQNAAEKSDQSMRGFVSFTQRIL